MSAFYDLASLVLVPSGTKAQKIYAQKPLTTDGQLAFTRASTATRVGPDGLIEKVRTNIILQSQTFDNAGWSKTAVTATANSTTAPDGTTTAETITETATSAQHQFLQSVTTAASIATFSIYLKANGRNFATLFPQGSGMLASATIDLSNGTINSTGGAQFLRSSIENAGNGWYRVQIALTTTANSLSCVVYLSDILGGVAPIYLGDGTSGIFAWGAQLETGDIATPYIPTTTAAVSVGMLANVPRLSYLGGGCPKLLLEPQRVNLQTFSEQHNNAGWTKLNLSVTANAGTSPAGFTDADLVFPDAGVVNLANYNSQTRFGLTIGASYTQSVFLKASGFTWAIVDNANGASAAWFNLVTGTIGTVVAGSTAKIENYGNGWYRCSVTSVSAGTTGYGDYRLANANGNENVTASGTNGILAWGFQFEAGAYATSYIPTLGAAVTRSADAASKTGISALIGQTEGTLFVEATLTNVGPTNKYLMQVSVNSNNRFFIYREGGTNKLACFAFVGGTSIFAPATPTAATGTIKAAFAYKSGDFAFFVNGVQIAVSSATYTTPASIDIFNLDSNAGLENGFFDYKQALLFKTRLTNAQLAELTA